MHTTVQVIRQVILFPDETTDEKVVWEETKTIYEDDDEYDFPHIGDKITFADANGKVTKGYVKQIVEANNQRVVTLEPDTIWIDASEYKSMTTHPTTWEEWQKALRKLVGL